MKSTDLPALVGTPFGENGIKTPISQNTSPGTNAASYNDGFPAITMTELNNGGLPPRGSDFNQILYELAKSVQWAGTGALYKFSAEFATKIGGYPKGSKVIGSDGDVYECLIDDNMNDPVGGAGWVNKREDKNTRELWRRSLAEIGLTLVPGSFKEGATVNSATDAVWDIDGAQCYTWVGDFPHDAESDPGAGWVSVKNDSVATLGARTIELPNGGVLNDGISSTSVEQKGVTTSATDNGVRIQSAINDVSQNIIAFAKPVMYPITSPIRLRSYCDLFGSGERSGVAWNGGNGISETNRTSVILAKATNPATDAIANTRMRELRIDLAGASNVIGVDAQYISVQSLIEGVRVQNPGSGSIGFYLSKSWYASMNRISIRGVEPNRAGIGLYIDTKIGQVNSVPINVQCSALDTGIILDTRNNYLYDLTLTGQIEKCRVGLQHIARRGLRTARISMYFESNSEADVIWGQATELPGTGNVEASQQIIWDGCTFSPTKSKVVLYEGRHWFRAIDRLNEIEINGSARVRIDGSVGTVITNNTGLPLAQVVEYVTGPTNRPATNRSAVGSDCMYFLGKQFNQSVSTGSVSFDIASIFNSIGANGQCAQFDVLIRRSYENNSPLCYSGFIQVNAAKEFGLYVLSKTASAAYIEPTITTDGIITLFDSRAGTCVYSLTVRPN